MIGGGAATGVARERRLGGAGLPFAALLWRGGGAAECPSLAELQQERQQ